MPLLKQVTSLKELCLEDFTRRLVFHGECFQKSEEGEWMHGIYKLIQRFFTDIILDKFFTLLGEKRQQDRKMKRFVRLFFFDEKAGNPSDWPCLEFLFNEYTTSIAPLFRKMPKIPEETCRYISSKCENLQKVHVAFGNMFGSAACEVLSHFQHLQFVDVAFPDGSYALKLLEMCPLITRLHLRDTNLHDPSLLSLCKHQPQSTKFQFCPENGACSRAGKKLQFLYTEFYSPSPNFHKNRNVSGIACALQHLPELKSFSAGEETFCLTDSMFLPLAILMLQDSAQENGKPFVYLELTRLRFFEHIYYNVHVNFEPEQLKKICLSCPKLEYLQTESNFDNQVFSMITSSNIKQLFLDCKANNFSYSSELEELLVLQGPKIRALHFDRCGIDIKHLNNILNACCNLKEFSFSGMARTAEISHSRSMPSAIASLEKIAFDITENSEPLANSYFCKILCKARSVKWIALISVAAEQAFFSAMKKNDFCCLEEIFVISEEAGKMCMDKLMNENNCLRKICLDDDIEEMKTIAAQRNYDVEIDFAYNYIIF